MGVGKLSTRKQLDMHPIEINQLLSDMYCITQELLRRPMTVDELAKRTNIPRYSLRLALDELTKHKHIYRRANVWRHSGMKHYNRHKIDLRRVA